MLTASTTVLRMGTSLVTLSGVTCLMARLLLQSLGSSEGGLEL